MAKNHALILCVVTCHPKSVVPNSRSAFHNPRSDVPNPRGAIPNSRGAVPNSRGVIPNPKVTVPNPRGTVPNPTTMFLRRTPNVYEIIICTITGDWLNMHFVLDSHPTLLG